MFLAMEIILVLVLTIPLIIIAKKRKAEGRPARGGYAIIFIVLLALIVLWNIYLSIYVNWHWFESKGYLDVFRKTIAAKWILFGAGFIVSFAVFFINIKIALKSLRDKPGNLGLALGVGAVFAVIMGGVLSAQWNDWLLNRFKVEAGFADPVFGRDISYYLFSLPFRTALLSWITSLAAVPLILLAVGALIGVIIRAARKKKKKQTREIFFKTIAVQLFLLGAVWAFLIALKQSLNVHMLVVSARGVVIGAGYTDLHAGIFGIRMARIIWICAGLILALSAIPGIRRKMYSKKTGEPAPGKIVALPVCLIGLLLITGTVVPGIQQGLRVLPDELNAEKPYIEGNIKFTRTAYSIGPDHIEEREISVGRTLVPEVAEANRAALEGLRLWDYRALADYLKEYQEIKPYYEFHDVDVERYRLDGKATQVMLAVRELNTGKLDERARTWVNRTLKYTHGYGLAMAPANEFISGGQPNLIIKNLPMETTFKELKLDKPQVYYGELTDEYILTSPLIDEFDFPVGDENASTKYDGSGGIILDSGWKKFCFAWRLNSHQMLVSPEISRETRIHLNRSIQTIVTNIAPWLTYDADPYAVLSGGRIKWIGDAYTVSSHYPYSAYYYGSKAAYHGVNYITNAAKVVIDAYDGSVTFYLFDEEDPIIRTYERIFPSLFAPASAMPAEIQAHLRYPEDFFTIQLEMYATYHMKNAEVFYTKEDVWQRAKEKYHGLDDVEVEPYYIIASLPGEREPQFILMSPYTPLEKNVLRSWLCALCDGDNYGKLIVYKFPKGEEIKGPRMIESRIDQDSEMSQVLSLWNREGSQVIRGNLMVVPLFFDNLAYLLYVEPVFLQADGAKMPELKKIVLADQDRIVWGDTFDEALKALTGASIGATSDRTAPDRTAHAAYTGSGSETASGHLSAMKAAFDRYKRLQSEGRFAEAGAELEKIYDIIEGLERAE